MKQGLSNGRKRSAGAFTLVEVVLAIAITAVIFTGIFQAYIQLARRAEWSGYSLAAQGFAIQQLEQARSAVWDASSAKNEITNLNLLAWSYNAANRIGKGYSWGNLDLPVAGTNFVRVTNYVTVRTLTNITGIAGISLQMVQVDTVWPFNSFGQKKLFTNTIVNYYAPDNPDAGNF